MPRVVGPIRRPNPVQVRDVEFLRGHTTRPIKITVPGRDHPNWAEAGMEAYDSESERGKELQRPGLGVSQPVIARIIRRRMQPHLH